MLPPTVKQFFFKLLISIFVHDYKNVLRQYRQAYTTQRQMKQYLRVITPEDLYDKELVRISERFTKTYLSTAKKGTKRRGNISQTKSTVTQNTKTSRSRRIRYSPNFPIFQLRYKRKRR